MKKQCKPWLFILVNIFVVLNLLCYFGIRSMWSGIIRYTFEAMPYILLFSLTGVCLLDTVLTIQKKYLWVAAIPSLILGILFFGLDWYIISLTTEASYYFIREFLHGLAYVGGIAAVCGMVFGLSQFAWFRSKWVISATAVLLFCGGVICLFDVQLLPNTIDCTPAVFAVEDTYQIVFTTRAKGTGWVEIDGVEYNDTYAGYRNTESRIHKVTVPMEALDQAGEYTLYGKAMILRGPYSSFQGKTTQETYSWRGVDTTDGLQYYAISDVHNVQNTPVEAASYYGDDLDFLINCGDQVSWIDREEDLEAVFRMCGRITKGAVPVVYARGNHETKGWKAHELHNYVGTRGEDFYYTFRMKNIWGVVLDVGEDHGDDFVEYYGAAKFNDYRDAQTAFLDEILAHADTEFDAPGVDYRIAVSHISPAFKYNNDHAATWKDAWAERLNQMKLTISFSGHVHELWFFEEDFEDNATVEICEAYSGKATDNRTRILTAVNFPAILVSRKSEGQTMAYEEYVFDQHFIGVAAESDGETTTLRYTTEKGETLKDVISPWYGDVVYGEMMVVGNKK